MTILYNKKLFSQLYLRSVSIYYYNIILLYYFIIFLYHFIIFYVIYYEIFFINFISVINADFTIYLFFQKSYVLYFCKFIFI